MNKAQDVESLVNGSVQLGSLPMIFYQINEAVEDPECSFDEIGKNHQQRFCSLCPIA